MTTQEKLNEIDSIRNRIRDIDHLISFIDELSIGNVSTVDINIQIKDTYSIFKESYIDHHYFISRDDLKMFVLHHKDDLLKEKQSLTNKLDLILK